MAGKLKLHGIKSMHTAGIFSDMTVDGPVIGTLVVIVDRAKNLPNRKTIGKQNPYCAARLAKEAKKTDTDYRGGQTPKWDQELRYTVHDSPDYYQLKISVFNDDKKTDLIGETRIDLRDIVVPGGGQNDLWHSLNCKGKYAGEVRIEITYYDTRSKQEKADDNKLSTSSSMDHEAQQDELQTVSIPRQQPKKVVNRRLLPSDPITGEPSPDPSLNPGFSYPTPLRSADQAAFIPSTYSTMQTAGPDHSPSRAQSHSYGNTDFFSFPSRNRSSVLNCDSEHVRSLHHSYQTSYAEGSPEISNMTQREYQNSDYINPPTSIPAKEYSEAVYSSSINNGAHRSNARGNFSETSRATAPAASAPLPHQSSDVLYESSRDQFQQTNMRDDKMEDLRTSFRHRNQHTSRNVLYDIPPPEELMAVPSPKNSPPPPPIHRSSIVNHHSNRNHHLALNTAISYQGQGSHRHSPNQNTRFMHDGQGPPQMYEQNGSYQAYSPERNQAKYQNLPDEPYSQAAMEDISATRLSGGYRPDLRRLQNHEDDIPNRKAFPHSSRTNDQVIDQYGLGNTSRNRNRCTEEPTGAISKLRISEMPATERVTDSSSYTPQQLQPNITVQQESRSDIYSDYRRRNSDSCGLPQVPITLVPGLASRIAEDVGNRIYNENQIRPEIPTHRRLEDKLGQQNHNYHQETIPPFEQQLKYSNNISQTVAIDPRQKEMSSKTQYTSARKSVGSSRTRPETQRRDSGIPFGPESYNILNPNINSSTPNLSLSAAYNVKKEHVTKIITQDGREVDPIDHIPESNYAPLLETKCSKYTSQLPERDRITGPRNPQNSIGASDYKPPPRNSLRTQSSVGTSNFSPASIHNNRHQDLTTHTRRRRPENVSSTSPSTSNNSSRQTLPYLPPVPDKIPITRGASEICTHADRARRGY